MKNPHHLAALISACNKHAAHQLPPDVVSVAARLGPPMVRDRKTGAVSYLFSSNTTAHLFLSGDAVVGGVLSPSRKPVKQSGASPAQPLKPSVSIGRRILAFVAFP